MVCRCRAAYCGLWRAESCKRGCENRTIFGQGRGGNVMRTRSRAGLGGKLRRDPTKCAAAWRRGPRWAAAVALLGLATAAGAQTAGGAQNASTAKDDLP